MTAAAAATCALLPGWRRQGVVLRYSLIAAGVATIGTMVRLLLGLGFV